MANESDKTDVKNIPAGQAQPPSSPASATGSATELTESDKRKVQEALHLLEEVAVNKGDELKLLMQEKYANLKSIAKETESTVVAKFHQVKAKATESTLHAKEVTTEKAVEVARNVDKSVHEKPWQFIGGVAISSLLLGWILGRRD